MIRVLCGRRDLETRMGDLETMTEPLLPAVCARPFPRRPPLRRLAAARNRRATPRARQLHR
jgi:hypothetical protein